MKRLTMATAFTFAALSVPTWAQAPTPAEHDSHHPSDSSKSGPAPAVPAPSAGQPGTGMPQGGMGGMPMMGMMKGMMNNMPMMNMMNMMNMMETMQAARMMGPGMGGMATIDRVEGRIAFLRAELKITDAQVNAWNSFADTLRANAKKLGEVRAQQPALTMTDRLDRQELWLLARLEGTRAMKSAFAKLNETLSDEQKQAANDLLAPHMGMMAMMGTQMRPGQMGPGQMGPGMMGPGMMQPGQMQGMGNK